MKPATLRDYVRRYGSDVLLELNCVQWLPSGKQLSFCYQGALYTVPDFIAGR